jgi:hypothetical protein
MIRVGECGVRLARDEMGHSIEGRREESTFDVQVCEELVFLLGGVHGCDDLRSNRSISAEFY